MSVYLQCPDTYTHILELIRCVMSLARYGRRFTAQKKVTLEVGLILCQSCCYGTTIMIVTYIWNLFSTKHYWWHILVKFWASNANIKRMRVLQILSLNITIRSLYYMSVCLWCSETCTHTLKVKPWEMFLALYGPNVSDEKMASYGVGVTCIQLCCYGYQSSGGHIFLNLFSIKHYLRQF